MSEMFEKIGRYQLVCLLGGGGMGEVWSVVDPELGTAKALKILRPSLGWDEQYRVLFAREAKVAAQLGRHPGFPAIHDFDASGDLPYLVMDYIDGVNLRALAKAGGLNEGQAVQVMRALFRALVIAHGNRRGSSEANVVHGDIKPENIMVSSHGDVFLTDFGISRFVEGRVVTSSIIGTIPYMAPEAFDGVVCVQGDLFAAGLILHELLCGERVHSKGATVLDVKKAYKRGVPPLGGAVHPELESLRQMLLQVDVDDRLVSAEDALEILKRVEVVDRRDELADLYRRLIGPPHTGLTQYLQSADTPGSFLPEYFGERDSMGEEEPATVSVGVGALAGEIEPDGPGHTVAIPDDELLAARQGGGAFRKGEIEQLGSPEALIPTPSHVVHAGTEPVEFEIPMDVQEPRGREKSRQRWWMLAVALLASVGGSSAIGYVLFGRPSDDSQADHAARPESRDPKRDAEVVVLEPDVPPLVIPASNAGHPANDPAVILAPAVEEPAVSPAAEVPVVEEEGGLAKSDEEARPPEERPRAKTSKKVPPMSKVVFYVGAGHPAAVIQVGKNRHGLAELGGEPTFEELLAPGRVRLSFCQTDGSCKRYGVIRVPALEPSESLFVNLRHDKPRAQRRGGDERGRG